MSPSPPLPNLAIMFLLHASKLPKTIRHRQYPTHERGRTRHDNGYLTRGREFPMLDAADVDERGDDTCQGVQEPRTVIIRK